MTLPCQIKSIVNQLPSVHQWDLLENDKNILSYCIHYIYILYMTHFVRRPVTYMQLSL